MLIVLKLQKGIIPTLSAFWTILTEDVIILRDFVMHWIKFQTPWMVVFLMKTSMQYSIDIWHADNCYSVKSECKAYED